MGATKGIMPANTLLRNIGLCGTALGLALSSCAKEPAISAVHEGKLEFGEAIYMVLPVCFSIWDRTTRQKIHVATKSTKYTGITGEPLSCQPLVCEFCAFCG